MKRRILFALLLTFISFTALNAEDWSDELECIPYEPPGGFQSLPASALEGPHKVLVIAATTTGDIERGWSNLAMPVWLRDSFIAPDPASINAGQYKWGISNFWAAASHGVYQIFGDVNPGNNGNLFVSDHDIGSYPTEGDYIKHILEKADAVIDYSQYDYDHDGYVDYIFFLLPRAPDRDEPPDQPQIPWWACPPACAGLSGIRMYDLLLLDNTYVTGTGYSCGTTCYRWQDTLGLYRDKIPGKWYDIPNFSLHGQVGMASHEMGHNRLGLKDYYDRSCAVYYPDLKITKVNRFAVNNEMGWYSIMNLTGQPHASMFSAPELAEHAPSSWVNVQEVDENSQNFLLYDMLSSNGQILKLNVGPAEYFLLSAHMQSSPYSHWEELMGGVEIVGDDTIPRESKGVLVWHICHRSDYMYSSGYSYELAASYDLECAGGKWALFEPTGPNGIGGFLGYYPPYENSGPVNPDNPQPEVGFDRLNLTTGLRWEDPSFGYGMYTNPHDFFGTWTEAYIGAFTSMTNPSSDAYNDATFFNYTFPANDHGQYGIYDWPEVVEPAVYQNLASHVGLEGMHQGGTDYMQLCIRRSRIWTDEEYAMDRTTQRKLLYDPIRDTFHFIYPSKGYIYYTQSYDPAMRWYTADLLGHGIWPAIALDSNNQAMAVWFDSSQVMYNYHDYDLDWHYRTDSAAVLRISGVPGPVAIDYGFGSGLVVNPGGAKGRIPPPGGTGGLGLGTVHLAYITRVNGQDQLRYARFLEMAPEDLVEDSLDVNITEDSTRITGVSIEVDNVNDKVSIAYGCVKNDTAACFYYERTTTGWHGPYKFTLSKSDSLGEPLVPFVDIDSVFTRVVFNANERIYLATKLRTYGYDNWLPCTLVTRMTGWNRYPQIAGNMITWTNYPTPDSSNVYGRLWPDTNVTRLDSAYGCINYFCQAAKTNSGTACLYQHGTFYHPEPCWAIYYRGPDGFGGNQETDGPGQLLIPKPEEFTMAIYGNVIRSNQFHVFTSGGDCELTVYDITGRRVTKIEIKDVPKAAQITTAVDCSDWSKGIYFVRAIPKEGPVRTAKVVRIR